MYIQMLQRQAAAPPELGDPNAGVSKNVHIIMGVAIGSIALSIISVVVRLACRKSRKMALLADDWFIVVAMLFTIADAAAYLWGLRYGFGTHIWTVKPADGLAFGLLVFVTFQLYGGAVTMIKIGVLLFYHRVFGRKYKTWLYILGGISIAWWIVISLASAFQCAPVAKAWNPELPGKCIPYLNIFIGIQVTNIALDIAILVLPISAVMQLQMSPVKKWSVGGTFGLGGLSIIFAAVRLYILIRDQNQTDISFDVATANWSLVEPAFELFCASIPCYAPLLSAGKYLTKLKSSLYGSSSSKSTRNVSNNSGRVPARDNFQRIENYPKDRKPSTSSTNTLTRNETLDDVQLRQIAHR